MSTSPKYSTARLREQQERHLREQRERQAALEAERRRREEERRRRQRFEEVKQQAQRDAGSLASRLTSVLDTKSSRFVSADLQRLGARVRQIAADVEEAGDEASVLKKRMDLERLEYEMHLVIARGEAEQLAADLADRAADLAVVKRLVDTIDQYRSLRFDPAGLQEVRSLITQADAALAAKSIAQADQLTEQARQQLDRHVAEVNTKFERQSEQRATVERSLMGVEDCVAGLAADAVVVCWKPRALQGLRERAERAKSLLEAEQFDSATTETAAILTEADRLVAEAQQMQLKEDRRRYIVNGIVQVMQQIGFVVQGGYPTLEYPEHPESACLIQAKRVSGEDLAVSVPQEGDVWYAVKGYPMRVETATDGSTARSCDEAEEQIQSMHRVLDETFGIEMSELTWDGMAPERIRKRAEVLPERVSRTSDPREMRQGN